MKIDHTFKGVDFVTNNTDGVWFAEIANVPVTGTHSNSRGEAAMRFTLMIESLLERESQPMQVGDVLEVGDKRYMIDQLSCSRFKDDMMTEVIECLHLREHLGGGEVNYRGPSSGYAENQNPTVSLSGGPFTTRPKVARYEFADVEDIEFWAWCANPCADGGFKYKREVNVWREVKS